MSAGKRPHQQRQSQQQPIIYEEDSNGAALPPPTRSAPPNRQISTHVWKSSQRRSAIPTAMLRRVFFIAEDKLKYVSVGYYPARGYQPLAEFGGAKKPPLLLNAQQLQTMADNIAALCNALSTNKHFAKKDGDFKTNTTGSYRLARVHLGKPYLSFTYEELRNLAYIMYTIQNQMAFYITAMTDVMAYIDTVHDCYFCGASLHRKQMCELLSSV